LNDYLLSVLLGVIEGLTEFLPVSSTAHLRIAEAFLGIDLGNGYWKMFSIVIQLGAILCLPIYFWNRIIEFLRDFPHGKRGDRTAINHPLALTMIAFVVTALPAFLLTKVIGKHLENLHIMAWSLLIGGVIMWAVDAIYERSKHTAFARGKLTEDMEQMSLSQAVWIGFCQIFSAVFPGTSRSMSTITAGELAGMGRPSALEFSFFLSIPTMVVATFYDLFKSLRPLHGQPSAIGSMPSDAHSWVVLAIGFVVSFIVAYGVVAWFMNWVRTRGFTLFAIYRIVLGIFVLWWAGRLS
jgi:undecaprenyl-diphosphatase